MSHDCFAGDRTVTLANLGWLGPALFGHCSGPGCESMCFTCFRVSNDFLWASVWHPSTLKDGEGRLCTPVTWFPSSSSLVSARYASYSGSHERSGAWHQNPLPVWGVEQKRSVCTDTRQRYRCEILTRDFDSFDIRNDIWIKWTIQWKNGWI